MNKIEIGSLRSSSFTILVVMGAFISLTTGCATGHHAHHRKTASRMVIQTFAVRDANVRSEIDQELGALSTFTEKRLALLESFKSEPLLGPVTLARVDEVFVAQYKARNLAREFANGTVGDAATAETLPMTAGEARTELRKMIEPSEGWPASFIPSASEVKPGAILKTNGSRDELNIVAVAAKNSTTPLPIASVKGPPTASVKQHEVAQRAKIENQPAPPVVNEPGQPTVAPNEPPLVTLKKLNALENSSVELSAASETPLIFDIPVTYNERVSQWIRYFQTSGRGSFRLWLERSARYLPILQYEFTRAGLPQDLVYVAMIESGFRPDAVSHRSAMGLWQFIAPTGSRYGLQIDWWIDERKDFHKSTRAAISYMTDLYQQFNSWYLVAASYNMGEGGVRRLIARHKTNNFWDLANKHALPRETTDYVPKIIAAMLISKAPALYGFRDLTYHMPLAFESMKVPGGTDLINLANYLGVSEKYLKDMNPELVKGFIPREVNGHSIRVPKGSLMAVSQFIRNQARESAAN